MLNEESRSSILNKDPVIKKCYRLYTTVKTIKLLLNNPYTGSQFWRLEQQVKAQLQEEIIRDLCFIVENINDPEILGNKMLNLSIAARYGWSGRGIEKEVFH